MLVQVLALDRRFVLWVLQPCWCWCFRFTGAAAVLVLVLGRHFVWPVLVQALALDLRFVLRHARDDIMSCPERQHVMPGDTMSCQR